MNKQHRYKESWQCGDIRVIECEDCGFKHLDPIPSKEVISRFYEEQYYQEALPFDYSKVNDEYVDKLSKYIPNNILFKDVYSKVGEILNNSELRSFRMLDIGCGNNLLSKYFQINNWEAYAIEPNVAAVEYLKRFELNVFHQFIDGMSPLPVPKLTFVNLQHVLEHLRDPISVLTQVHNSMNQGGVIRVVVPNDFSETQLAHHEHYDEPMKWIRYPDHINYFSFASLSNLLKTHGFEEVYRTATFPVDFFLLAGENYYTDVAVQKRTGPAIRNFEKAFRETGRKDMLDKLYESLAKQGFGRSIIMYAVKR